MGWLTTEELCWNSEGRLTTHAPSTYKIPAVGDCPADFRVALFDNHNIKDTIHRSKAVGEPPLPLSFSVFNAIRDAVSSAQDGHDEPPIGRAHVRTPVTNAQPVCPHLPQQQHSTTTTHTT